ncbi:MAG: PIN domain-containing protein [Solirubrobacterales bacterium]
MSQADPPRAVLDADIIYSRVLHDLMGRVADDLRLLDLVWSEELLAEARRSLIGKKGLAEEVAVRWVDYLPRNFPTGATKIEEGTMQIDLDALTDDPDDHHVCALAIASGADYLFTHDRGYLRKGLQQHGIEVTAPDPFLTAAFEADHQELLGVLERQASSWAGGQPIEELLAAIERAGAPELVGKARGQLGG